MAPWDTKDETVPRTDDPSGCSVTKVRKVSGSLTATGSAQPPDPDRRPRDGPAGGGGTGPPDGPSASSVAASIAAWTAVADPLPRQPRRDGPHLADLPSGRSPSGG